MILHDYDLSVVIIDDNKQRKIQVQLQPFLKPVTLWERDQYDLIGDYTQTQVENKIREIITTKEQLESLHVSIKNTVSQSKIAFRNPYHIKYNSSNIKDAIIIISYFNFCNYKKPKNNLLTVLYKLLEAKLPVCVVEASIENSDFELPKEINHIKFKVSKQSTIFLKENLYNIAAKKLSNYSKFIFMDNDVVFNEPYWYFKTSDMLNYYDIIQPFDKCYWVNKNNDDFLMTKDCAAKFLIETNLKFYGSKYHPGFCWAMTREFFEKIGGFYERCILGGGDLSFLCSLDRDGRILDDLEKQLIINKNKLFDMNNEEYIYYKKSIDKLSYKINYLKDCKVYHLYHGSKENRKYNSRYDTLKNCSIELIKNQDGILELTDKDTAKKCYEYFYSRKEDEENVSISSVYVCMNREKNLLESIESWIDVPEITEFIIVDWSSSQPLIDNPKIKTWIEDKKIKLIRVQNEQYFSQTKAYNLAFNYASNKIILKLDADFKNIDSSWIKYLKLDNNKELDNYFIVGNFKFSESLTGFALINKKDFVYYNENMDGWGYDDRDLYNRVLINNKNIEKIVFFNILDYIHHIPHSDEERTVNYKTKDKNQSNIMNSKIAGQPFRISTYKTIFEQDNYIEVLKN